MEPAQPVNDPFGLAPPEVDDPVLDAFKKDVDRTLLIENLRLSLDERMVRYISFIHAIDDLHRANREQSKKTQGNAG